MNKYGKDGYGIDDAFTGRLSEIDPFVDELIDRESERQEKKLIMIPSESIVPPPVREALGSAFQNIYAEGYPRGEMLRFPEEMLKDFAWDLGVFRRYGDRRFYKGVEYVDIMESLARRRAAQCFVKQGLPEESIFVNVQPLSGSAANLAVYSALLSEGDTIMGLDLFQGGHLTHGSRFNQSGKRYHAVSYGVDPKTEKLDYDAIRALALHYRPKMIIAGYTAYTWAPDWSMFRAIADEVGAFLLADISHTVGLAIAGVYPDPVGIADVTMFTTHKTLCGPRGAVIITTDKKTASKIDKAVFPGTQGGPHVNKIAAMAVAFKLARTDAFKKMQRRIVENARTLASSLSESGLRIVHGGTDTHIVLLDVGRAGIGSARKGRKTDKQSSAGPTSEKQTSGEPTSKRAVPGEKVYGEVAARVLDSAGIVVNKNTIPGDSSTHLATGIRFGTPWLTQRGFGPEEMKKIAKIIHTVVTNIIPFAYDGVAGKRPKGKIDFDVLLKAKREVAVLIANKKSGHVEPIDSTAGSGYPHFWGCDEGPRTVEYLHVYGEKAREFLQEVCATNIALLLPGECTESVAFSPEGDLFAEMTVACVLKDRYDRERYYIRINNGEDRFVTWMRALSDGYVVFDREDVFRKTPGPVVVEEVDEEDLPSEINELFGANTLTSDVTSEASAPSVKPDITLPYFIGQAALLEKRGITGKKGYVSETGNERTEWNYQEPEREELHRTPLFEVHKKLGAKMVPFAGWEMPVWYAGVTEEHTAVREAAGLFDVAHMGCFEARGPHAAEFLQSVTTNDVADLDRGSSCYGFLLDPDGKIIDDLIVYRIEDERYLLVVNAVNEAKDWDWLSSVNEGKVIIDKNRPWTGVRVSTELVDLKQPEAGSEQLRDLAVQGPKARDILVSCATVSGGTEEHADRIISMRKGGVARVILGGSDVLLSRTGYTGESFGYELFVHPGSLTELWNKLLEAGGRFGIKPCGLACRDSTRIEAGLPLYGHELAGKLDISPAEAGFQGFVKYYKSFFIGRDALLEPEMVAGRGSARRIARWTIERKGVRKPNPEDPVVNKQGTVVGEVTSCSVDQRGNFVGLALIREKDASPGNEIGIFVLPRKSKEEKRKDLLQTGDKVMLPVTAEITPRFLKKR